MSTKPVDPERVEPEPEGAEPEFAGTRPGDRRRAFLAAVLVVLTAAGIVLSASSLWLRTTLFDTEAFMDTVDPALESEEFGANLGTYVADQVVIALDLQMRLDSGLGEVGDFLSSRLGDALGLGPAASRLLGADRLPRLTDLAAPLTQAAEDGIRVAVEDYVQSPEFRRQLPEVVASAHTTAVAVLRGEQVDNVVVQDGEVRLNLVPTVATAIGVVAERGLAGFGFDVSLPDFTTSERAGDAVTRLSDALGVSLPEGFGQVTVMSEAELEQWQSAARILDRLTWALLATTALLLAGAIVVSPRRRRTLVQLAFATVIGLLLAEVAQRNSVDAVLGVISDTDAEQAATLLLDQLRASLRRILFGLIVVAAVIGAAAHVAGRPGWLDREERRRLDATVSRHPDGFRVAGLGVAVAAWLLFGLGLVSFIVVGSLLGGYLAYVWQATRPTSAPVS